jgi:hypothetical protein
LSFFKFPQVESGGAMRAHKAPERAAPVSSTTVEDNPNNIYVAVR